MGKKVVIIGGGVAGTNAAIAVSSKDSEAEITMISREEYLPYYRIKLTELLDTDIPMDKLSIKKKSWYEDKKINLILGKEVDLIDSKNKKVILDDKEEFPYDSLVIATGANCFVPPFENRELENIVVIRELKGTLEIKENCKSCKKAVIIGGGVLGLEAAWGLKNLGLEVSVLEVMPRIMPRQLDEKASEILEEIIISSGVNIYKNVKVKGFAGDKKVEKVILEDGELDADLVIVSAGIRPNISFEIDEKLDINRGIVVDEKMQTSLSDIYACGDIAEYNGKIIGLWTTGMEQGRVAGASICQEDKKYMETVQPLTFEGMNTKLLSVGEISSDDNYLVEFDDEKKIYKKLVFKDEVLKGAILIGDTSKQVAIVKGVREGISKKDILSKIYV